MSPERLFPRATLLSLAVLAILSACAEGVRAEANPYYLGAHFGVTSDDNVLRERDGSERSDTVTAVGLRAGVDQPLGRSRLLLDLAGNQNRYSRLSEYNHADYNLLGRLDWETIERLSGTVVAESRQSLYRDTSRVDTERNLARTTGLSLQARLGVVTMWSFDAGVAANRTRYSSAAYRTANYDQRAISGGLRFAPSPDIAARLGLRRTDAKYPDYGDDVGRNDVELGLTLRPSGASSFDAHVSRTRESHTRLTIRDKSGWTGSLGWNWQASGKTSIGLRVSRDSAVGSYSDLGLSDSEAGDSTQRTAISLKTQWEATSKIRLDARLEYARRTLDNALTSSATGVSQSTRDNTTTAHFGVTYQLLRNVDLGCGVTWTDRSVSNELSTLTYPYSDTSVNCYGQVFLR